MKKKATAVPKAVSEYMAAMAHKANAAMKGTATAKERASKAAKARWAKHRAKKAKKDSHGEASIISQKGQNTKL
jgi:hypothetical protein